MVLFTFIKSGGRTCIGQVDRNRHYHEMFESFSYCSEKDHDKAIFGLKGALALFNSTTTNHNLLDMLDRFIQRGQLSTTHHIMLLDSIPEYFDVMNQTLDRLLKKINADLRSLKHSILADQDCSKDYTADSKEYDEEKDYPKVLQAFAELAPSCKDVLRPILVAQFGETKADSVISETGEAILAMLSEIHEFFAKRREIEKQEEREFQKQKELNYTHWDCIKILDRFIHEHKVLDLLLGMYKSNNSSANAHGPIVLYNLITGVLDAAEVEAFEPLAHAFQEVFIKYRPEEAKDFADKIRTKSIEGISTMLGMEQSPFLDKYLARFTEKAVKGNGE